MAHIFLSYFHFLSPRLLFSSSLPPLLGIHIPSQACAPASARGWFVPNPNFFHFSYLLHLPKDEACQVFDEAEQRDRLDRALERNCRPWNHHRYGAFSYNPHKQFLI
ncbi:hypothetical protein MRB53_028543 [Persea americana]|uniref:Uncharacterized protein n=1 Tax=Persea americana TaxID=3435 RepID=A0ACC2KFU5_PERAE|nr:hypothetical protein MRB53_028543 [Persea americana]